MRKSFVLAVVAVSVLGLAAPASAKPIKTTSESASANAFWYTTETLSRNTTRSTVWYVGAWQSTWGTAADVYREVATCRISRRGEDCTYESLWGFADLTGGGFSIDRDGLAGAALDAVFELYPSTDGRRATTGDPIVARVAVTWTGVGDVYTDGGTFTFRSKCYSYRETFEGSSRTAEAYGFVGDLALGETYDAWLGAGTSTSVERARDC